MKIRLPRTTKSHGLGYAILVHRICPQRRLGDTFEGRRFRPGARVAESELWPTPDHPETPLLLEYAGSDRSGSGHNRGSAHLYILWVYARATREWKELARSSGESVEWIAPLRSVAMRHIAKPAQASLAAAEDAVRRILISLDSETARLPDQQERHHFLGLLHEQFIARLMRESLQPDPEPTSTMTAEGEPMATNQTLVFADEAQLSVLTV